MLTLSDEKLYKLISAKLESTAILPPETAESVGIYET